jgi:type IV pilus assembly protein PilQ
VTVDTKNNQIIITDTAAVVRQAEDIVRRIDKVTAQVVIEARVVEVTSNFSRELGITWA